MSIHSRDTFDGLGMQSDTSFFTVCLFAGALIGAAMRYVGDPEKRETWYRQLTTVAIEYILPIHIFGTTLKAAASSNVDFAVVLLAGGIACTFAVLQIAQFVVASPRYKEFDPHFPYIAATFAGGGRAVVLLAAITPLVDPLIHGALDQRLQGKGGVLDALAIFDTGYWAFFTAIVYERLMPRSFSKQGSAESETTRSARRSVISLVTIIAVAAIFEDQIVKLIGAHTIDVGRFTFASIIIVLSTAAVVLIARRVPVLQSLRDIAFAIQLRLIGVGSVFTICLILLPDQLKILWVPMVVMIVAPPSSFIPQMLHHQGASTTQRDQAVALNIAWNVLLYGLIAVLALAAAIVGLIRHGLT